MWALADPTDLRQTWADELAGFNGDDFRDAFTVMRTTYLEFPPTLFQFSALCRDARAKRAANVRQLPPPRTPIPEAVREKLAAFVKAKQVA